MSGIYGISRKYPMSKRQEVENAARRAKARVNAAETRYLQLGRGRGLLSPECLVAEKALGEAILDSRDSIVALVDLPRDNFIPMSGRDRIANEEPVQAPPTRVRCTGCTKIVVKGEVVWVGSTALASDPFCSTKCANAFSAKEAAAGLLG